MSRAAIFVVSVTLLVPARVLAGDTSVIAGEPALLEAIRDAQNANVNAFPHGEMRVNAETGTLDFLRTSRRVEVVVKWDGDECRATGKLFNYVHTSGKPDTFFDERVDVLYNKKRRFFYLEDQKSFKISLIVDGKYPLLTRLRPDEWFYGKVDGEGMDWAERLELFIRRPTDALKHWRVLRLPGDQVELSYDGEGEYPGNARQVFSLAQGGNLVKLEQSDRGSGVKQERTYVWDRAGNGGWYPKSVRVRTTPPPMKDVPFSGVEWHYEVVAFDPTVRPPKSIFLDSAIHATQGTFVEDEITGKRYRIGGRNSAKIVDSLDGLSREVKSRGFAETVK